MLANYHTHTKWCNHAVGNAEDYIVEAINKGLKTIAITDHVPHKDNEDRYRMRYEEFEQFNYDLDEAIDKYSGKIDIIKGFECEHYLYSLKDYERYRAKFGYKIFVLGQHTIGKHKEYDSFNPKDKDTLLMYANESAEAIASGIYTLFAHPDLGLNGYNHGIFDKYAEKAMRIIYEACEKYDMPVEINANGLRHGADYPSIYALKISKDYKLRYIVNSDCHRPEFLADEYVQKAYDIAKELNIKPILELK